MMNSKIPRQFQSYGKLKPSLVSNNGIIKIELATDTDSKTFIKDLQTKAPLLIQKAMYPDTKFPKTAHIYIMSSSGGILQGDKMEIDIIAGENTSSYVTTQAATKIYKMEKSHASQYVNVTTQNDSYVEFLPNQIIPYKSSKFYQEVNLKIGTNSTMIYSEIISAGRLASGEKFDFDICFLRLTTYDENDKILFSDVLNMEPKKNSKEFEYLFANKTICSTIYIITKSAKYEKMSSEINLAIKTKSMLAGYSALPYDSGMVVRILSNSIDDIKDLISTIVNIVRMNVL